MVVRPTRSPGAADEPPSLPSGRRLAVARLVSTVIAASAAGVSILGLPALYAEFCALKYLDPAARDVVQDNLVNLGLSGGSMPPTCSSSAPPWQLACFSVAAVILWRRSSSPC